MKRNKLMALTASLTLLAAPSSKAQEVKGGSKQSTYAQSANKDSKAVDKAKEQTGSKNNFVNRIMSLGYTWDKIKKNWPWLAVFGITNTVSGVAGDQMGKKANVEAKVKERIDSGDLLKKDFVNSQYTKNDIVNSQYTKNDIVDNQYTKNDIVNNQYTKNDIFNTDYMKKADVETTVQERINAKIDSGDLLKKDFVDKNYTENAKVDARAQQIAGDRKYTDQDLASAVDKKIQSGELLKKVDVTNNYMTKVDVEKNYMTKDYVRDNYMTKADVKKNYMTKVDVENNYMTKDYVRENYTETKSLYISHVSRDRNSIVSLAKSSYQMVERSDREAILSVASNRYGVKYSDDDLKKRIDQAVSTADGFTNILYRSFDINKQLNFDNLIAKLDGESQRLLQSIQKKFSRNFSDILVQTKFEELKNNKWINRESMYGKKNGSIDNDKIVDALSMLADIKNALVDKQASDLVASFVDKNNTTNKAWCDFNFKLGSKKYNVYINREQKDIIYVTNDGDKTRYCIPLK